MSAERRRWKQGSTSILAKMGVGLLLLAGLLVQPGQGATTGRIVVDPNRGLALSGFDPVAYFTNAKPLMGRGDLEMSFAGATWRFRNEGNRAAFAENPEVYLPMFGGHDPVAVARGTATPGHPQIWLISGDRLYLFYTPEARGAFSADAEAIAAEAARKWAEVLLTISP
jgi:hypothetical protein